MQTNLGKALCYGLTLAALGRTIFAAELKEPALFAADKDSKTLDLLMIAKPAPVNALPSVTGWSYEICERRYSQGNSCLPGHANADPYAGARLQLNQGDTLKIRLVNQLPLIPESTHKDEDGEQFLAQNPTNLHTHGMLVSPSEPQAGDKPPLYGDNIFVLTFNPANGTPELGTAEAVHMHADVRTGYTDYSITVPEQHPSGLFWFHPHPHGISVNQITAGLSGIITVGQVGDYLPALPAETRIRHMILKDIQVNPDNSLHDQQDPDICDQPATAPGYCAGSDGSKWAFTLNGQMNPSITVQPSGELWRISNNSASATYELQLSAKNNGETTPIAMQIVSIDGISVTPTEGTGLDNIRRMGGAKFRPIPCPGVKTGGPAAVCASRLHMMPSSRVEIWVVNRGADGKTSWQGKQAVLQNLGYTSGPDGDYWPAVDLAQVEFLDGGQENRPALLNVRSTAGLKPTAIAAELAAQNAQASLGDENCWPLPAGWKRRIYFGYPTPDDFGLGLELIDEIGQPVPGTFQDVVPFTSSHPTVCLPLGPNGTPVSERWELVNLTAEDHNFHIHQTKFRVLTPGELTGTTGKTPSSGIHQDNVPLLSGSAGCDGTVATWRAGGCQTQPITVEIPFAIAGDFVYHCHILEHEDGGMMQVIRVAGKGPFRPDHDYHRHGRQH